MAKWWTLKILSGNDAGKVFALNPGRTLIGRIKGDVLLELDTEASSVHAEISFDPKRGTLKIHDLKSRNGVRINGKKVSEQILQGGERIKIGVTEMVLEPPRTEETLVSVNRATNTPETKSTFFAQPQDFNGYFKTFWGVLVSPTAFFDHIGDDLALKPALKFGMINWLLGGLLSGIMSYYFMFVWKWTPTTVDFGNSPVAIALQTFLGIALVPIAALLFHGLAHLMGGRAPFVRALQIACYISAVHFIVDLTEVLPKIGMFCGILGAVYMIALASLAAVRLYHVVPTRAYAFCALAITLSVASMLKWETNAKKVAFELTNRIKIQATPKQQMLTSEPTAVAPVEQTPQLDAAQTPLAPDAPIQEAAAPSPEVTPNEQRDPAAVEQQPAAVPEAQAPAADPAPPSFYKN